MPTPQFVFVSHASVDKLKIKFIVDELIRQNIKVWLDNPVEMGFTHDEIERDFYRIQAGGRWRDEIRRALGEATVVLVCWSKSTSSEVIRAEITAGWLRNVLVLCRIDDIDPTTLINDLNAEQIVDLSSETKRNHALAGMIRDIKAKMFAATMSVLEQPVARDPFEPYLVNRTMQEDAIGDAITTIMREGGGAKPFLIAGPENERPDAFIRRLEVHTSKVWLGDRCWYPIEVAWPLGREPKEFGRSTAFSHNLAIIRRFTI